MDYLELQEDENIGILKIWSTFSQTKKYLTWEKPAENNSLEQPSDEDLLSEPVWYNAHIRSKTCAYRTGQKQICPFEEHIRRKWKHCELPVVKEKAPQSRNSLRLRTAEAHDWLPKVAKIMISQAHETNQITFKQHMFPLSMEKYQKRQGFKKMGQRDSQ